MLPGTRSLLHVGDDHGARVGGEHHADAWQGLPAGAGETLSISQGRFQHRSWAELWSGDGKIGRSDQVTDIGRDMGKFWQNIPIYLCAMKKTNMLQKSAPFAPYPGPQALDLVCRDAICVSTFYLALCLAVRFPEAWNRKGTEGSPAIKNIATGETSQAITPYHFFNYLTSLAFITR